MSTTLYEGPEGFVTLAAGECQRCMKRGQCVEVDSRNGCVLKLCKGCWAWLHGCVLKGGPLQSDD